jgi:hypothetical protein
MLTIDKVGLEEWVIRFEVNRINLDFGILGSHRIENY